MTTVIARLFEGERWTGATIAGDHAFDLLPGIGQVLAIVADGEWRVHRVVAVAHRLADRGEAADVALLVSPALTARATGDALPLDLLDRIGDAVPATTRPGDPAPRPWG